MWWSIELAITLNARNTAWAVASQDTLYDTRFHSDLSSSFASFILFSQKQTTAGWRGVTHSLSVSLSLPRARKSLLCQTTRRSTIHLSMLWYSLTFIPHSVVSHCTHYFYSSRLCLRSDEAHCCPCDSPGLLTPQLQLPASVCKTWPEKFFLLLLLLYSLHHSFQTILYTRNKCKRCTYNATESLVPTSLFLSSFLSLRIACIHDHIRQDRWPAPLSFSRLAICISPRKKQNTTFVTLYSFTFDWRFMKFTFRYSSNWLLLTVIASPWDRRRENDKTIEEPFNLSFE